MFTRFTNSSTCASLLLFGLWVGSSAASFGQTITGFSPSTAAPGQTVTITGQNLGDIKSVMLHGLPVTVVKNTPSKVEVTVPRAAATGCLRLTTASGTVLTATKLGITRQSSDVRYAPASNSSVSPTASGNYSTPTISDLDKDGLVELLVGQGDGTIRVFEQTTSKSPNWGTDFLLKNSDGTTLRVVGGTNSTSSSYFAKPTLTDLDGDGLLELLVGEETGNVWRYEQKSAAAADAFTFTRTAVLFVNPYGITIPGRPNAGSYPRPTVADLDNDGLLDVVVGSNDGTLRRYEQTAPNAVSFNTLGQLRDNNGAIIDAGNVDKPLLTDYNGDGYLDMLLGNQSGSVVLYTQMGSDAVTFKPLGNLTTDGTAPMSMSGSNGGFSAPAVTDIDGDGLLDLFVGNGLGTVMRFEQTQSVTTPVITAPLPVVLAGFSGQASAAGNQLSWTTASELNSAYFAIERSTSGVVFSSIGQVAASGSSATARSYQYLDATAPAGTSYYRLRQVDQDGTTTYSPVVVLTQAGSTAAAGPQVFPTVFAQELSVALSATAEPQLATVALLTANGRVVYGCTVPLGAMAQPLAGLPALAAGSYLLRITTAAGTSTHRVLHQ